MKLYNSNVKHQIAENIFNDILQCKTNGMIFSNETSFSEEEKLILKLILSGVTIQGLTDLFPHHSEKITHLIRSIRSRMANPSVNSLESQLLEYSNVVMQKHQAVPSGRFDEAAKFRNQEKNYIDIGYELLFKDFDINWQLRQYIRYCSSDLLQQLDVKLALF